MSAPNEPPQDLIDLIYHAPAGNAALSPIALLTQLSVLMHPIQQVEEMSVDSIFIPVKNNLDGTLAALIDAHRKHTNNTLPSKLEAEIMDFGTLLPTPITRDPGKKGFFPILLRQCLNVATYLDSQAEQADRAGNSADAKKMWAQVRAINETVNSCFDSLQMGSTVEVSELLKTHMKLTVHSGKALPGAG